VKKIGEIDTRSQVLSQAIETTSFEKSNVVNCLILSFRHYHVHADVDDIQHLVLLNYAKHVENMRASLRHQKNMCFNLIQMENKKVMSE